MRTRSTSLHTRRCHGVRCHAVMICVGLVIIYAVTITMRYQSVQFIPLRRFVRIRV
jgi:hypothetical protein